MLLQLKIACSCVLSIVSKETEAAVSAWTGMEGGEHPYHSVCGLQIMMVQHLRGC
jgi:hypothetical protein